MKTFEAFISQSMGVIIGVIGGTNVGGPFGATVGAVGGLYVSEWLQEIFTSFDCSSCNSSKFITTVSSGIFAGIFITFLAYFLYQPLSILLNTLSN